MKFKALFSGTFKPFHLGHLEVLKQASKTYDVIIAISHNPKKEKSDPKRRFLQVRKFLDYHGWKTIPIVINEGITAQCAKNLNCQVLIRGYRDRRDFYYEQNLSFLNQLLGIKTVLYHTNCSLRSSELQNKKDSKLN